MNSKVPSNTRAQLQLALVRLVVGRSHPPYEKALSMLLDYVDQAAGDAARAAVAPLASSGAANDIADRLQRAYDASTAGPWSRSRAAGFHEVVYAADERTRAVGTFGNADDVDFVLAAHELAPAIIRALRATAGDSR